MELTVRRAENRDIPKLLELLVQVDMVHHSGRPDIFKGPATKYNAQELETIIAYDKTPVFVCADGKGEVLGHAFCIHRQFTDDPVMTDIKTLYIDDICVDEKFRGRHVGKALYEHVRDYALLIGCNNMTLNVWEGNLPAESFYRNMGMKVQKTTMEIRLPQPEK